MEIDEALKTDPAGYSKMIAYFKQKALDGAFLSHSQKYHLYSALKHAKDPDLPSLEEFLIDLKFEDLQMKYLYGDFKGNKITEDEQIELDKYIGNWKELIIKDNHKDELMQYISKETREQLKVLRKSPMFYIDGILRQNFLFRAQEAKLLMMSKKVYITVNRLFEYYPDLKTVYALDGHEIEFTRYSMTHILMRHYAQTQKPFQPGKSFHKRLFGLENIIPFLSQIFKNIDDSKAFQNQGVDIINFRYKGIDFRIYCNIEHKQIKGKTGNHPFYRLNTFFPVEEEKERLEIVSYYLPHQIDEELIIYVRKT